MAKQIALAGKEYTKKSLEISEDMRVAVKPFRPSPPGL
jgi:hypothetical protein